MSAGLPLTPIRHVPDVGTAREDGVNLASVELGHGQRVRRALPIDRLDERVEGVVVVGIKLEDPPHLGAVHRVHFHQAAAIDTNVAVAVGSLGNKQTVLDTAIQAVLHIQRLLLGVETRHARQHSALHPARRRVLGGLGHGDEREAALGFEPFKLDVIKQISSGPVHL